MGWLTRFPRTLKGLLLLLGIGASGPLLVLVGATYRSWYETRMEVEYRFNSEFAREPAAPILAIAD